MHRSSKNKRKLLKKYISSGIILALLMFGVVLLLELKGVTDFYSNDPQSNSPPEEFSPPTKEERGAGDKKKKEISENTDNQNAPTDVNVVVVDASQYGNVVEIRSFAANIIKDGECTFTFTFDGLLFSKKTPAYADASTTPCVTLSLPITDFERSGTWNMRVSYSANGFEGEASTTLEISR